MPKKCKNIANLLKPQNMKKYLIFILLSISSFVYSQSEVYNSSDILKMQENYIASIDRIEITKNRIENSSAVKPKKAEIISINNHLTEITYQYCKGIRALKQNNKITVNDKKNPENEYKRTIQKVMNDFSSAIKILLSGDPEVNNEGQIIYLSDIQKNMIKNNLLLIAYNETVSNNIKK